MQWWQDNAVNLFKAYGWQSALVVIVVLVLLAMFVVWVLGVDVGNLLSSVNWNRLPRGGAA